MIRRTIIVGIVLFAMIGGCAQNASKGDNIFFDGVPILEDNEIYHLGNPIGTVLSKSIQNNVTKVTIAMDKDHRYLITRNTIFYVKAGRLAIGNMGGYSEPSEPGAILCGFKSKSAYRWYRFKNILGDAGLSANQRAQMLNERFAAGS